MANNSNNFAFQASSTRLSAVTGSGGGGAGGLSARPERDCVEPDLSKIRKSSIDETPEEFKQRIAAKTVNYSVSITLRLMILATIGYFLWQGYDSSRELERNLLIAGGAVFLDLVRAGFKCITPGTR